MSSSPVRVLFFFRHNGFIRNFEWMLRLLAERGDAVELAFQFERGEGEIAHRLETEYENVRILRAPKRDDLWTYVVFRLRYGIDYLRYLAPEYAGATKLRARARKRAPLAVVGLAKLIGPKRVDSALRALERSVPPPKAIERFVSERRSDVVLVTPLVDGPWQEDYVTAARAVRIPTALPVASWDNLTNKGLIRAAPDRVYVWNEAQRREAVELHGIPSERVIAVGAHSYDHWFGWRPSTSREEFCARLGLRDDRPLLLYVCSSGFVAEDLEPEIVAEWIEALRGADDPIVRDASVLVRPHFRARARWDEVAAWENVAVWPPDGADPRTPEAKADYFDSLHHCAATVGANTSALIEAAIVGRKPFTYLHPKLSETQEGTLHFHYLTRGHGGPLETATSLDEHLRGIGETLRNPPEPGWSREFVEFFIRPQGLERDAAPILVDDVTELADTEPAPVPEASSALLRASLLPLALLTNLARPTPLWTRLFPRDVRGHAQPQRREWAPNGSPVAEEAAK